MSSQAIHCLAAQELFGKHDVTQDDTVHTAQQSFTSNLHKVNTKCRSEDLKKTSTVQLRHLPEINLQEWKTPSVTYSSSSTQASSSAPFTNIYQTHFLCQVPLYHGNMQTPPVPESQSIHSFHRTGSWQAAPSGKGWWKWRAQDTGWVFLSLG